MPFQIQLPSPPPRRSRYLNNSLYTQINSVQEIMRPPSRNAAHRAPDHIQHWRHIPPPGRPPHSRCPCDRRNAAQWHTPAAACDGWPDIASRSTPACRPHTNIPPAALQRKEHLPVFLQRGQTRIPEFVRKGLVDRCPPIHAETRSGLLCSSRNCSPKLNAP